MKKSQSFESNMAELEGLLNQLSDESTPLETAVALYAKAADKINRPAAWPRNRGVIPNDA